MIEGEWTFFLLEPSSGFGDFLDLPWARLYTITGIGLGLVVVVVGFTTDVGVQATILATTFSSGRDFSISLTLNCLFMGVLALFLSVAFWGVGTFCGGVALPS